MSATKVLEFKDITYSVVNEDSNIETDYANILSGLSGKFTSGRLTAVMGASGCGKTHFFDILAGNVQKTAKTSGQVLYNGKNRDWKDWTGIVSYLAQDDVYYPTLTILETLNYYLSFETNLSKSEKSSIIDKTLRDCRIYAKKNSKIESLSGGEMKRAMIAIAMITRPEVFILDEPTSGLDSENALFVVDGLRKYAREHNAIVILTVHQPGDALLNLFDDFIFLTRVGMFYAGTMQELEDWLKTKGINKPSKVSMSEFMLALHGGDTVIKEARQYEEIVAQIIYETKNKDIRLDSEEIANNYKVVRWTVSFNEALQLLKYNFRIFLRSSGFIRFLLIYAVIIGLYWLSQANIDNESVILRFFDNSKSRFDSFLDTMNWSKLLTFSYIVFSRVLLPATIITAISFDFNTFLPEVFKKEIFSGNYSVFSHLLYQVIEKFLIIAVLSTPYFFTIVLAHRRVSFGSLIYSMMYVYMLLTGLLLSLLITLISNVIMNKKLASTLFAVIAFVFCFFTPESQQMFVEDVFYWKLPFSVGSLLVPTYFTNFMLAKYKNCWIDCLTQEIIGKNVLMRNLYSIFFNSFQQNLKLKTEIFAYDWYEMNDVVAISLMLAVFCLNIVALCALFIRNYCPNVRTTLAKTK